MKILKNILIIVALTFIITFIGSLFLPSKYVVSRTIKIQAPIDTIFSYTNNLQQWNRWIIFNKDADTTFIIKYSGPEAGIGAKQYWESKKLGKGILQIIESKPNKMVVFEELLGENKFKAIGTFTFDESKDGVLVTWKDEGALGFNPIARIFGLFYDKLIGKDYEAGLQDLKKLCEGK